MREIVFDTETTGRDPEFGDRIVEIGAVELWNLAPTGRTLHLYVCPQCDVPEEVVRVHGLTTAFLADKPVFADLSAQIIEFFGDAPLVAHNAEFDRKFLNAEFGRLKQPPIPQERCIDTLAMARAKFRGASNSLDALARRFELDRYGFDLAARKGPGGHGALIDAKILAEVYLQLKGGREQKLALEDDAPAEIIEENATFAVTRRAARAKPLKPRLTAEEAALHASFIDTLSGEALWKKG